MDKIFSINTIKNVFSALGAKTSDSNYAVGLFDKTTAEPKGLMGMSDLATVLGVYGNYSSSDFQNIDAVRGNVNVFVSSSSSEAQAAWGSPTRYGFLLCRKGSRKDYEIQIYFVYGTSAPGLCYRTYNGTTWSVWYNVSFSS